jgi:hypothetical protein
VKAVVMGVAWKATGDEEFTAENAESAEKTYS